MLFKCGMPSSQRRKERSERLRERKLGWHRYFTLLPRRLYDDDELCVWLQYIERKGTPYLRTVLIHGSGMRSQIEAWTYEYRIPAHVSAPGPRLDK